jgi:glutamate N-acetyltransferase/amino-acid N-acetyltransferase
VLPASTGVIGAQLRMDLWAKSAGPLAAGLGKAGMDEFARAIMTTDSFPKYAGRVLTLPGGEVTLAAAAKGAGMICPNMATMISLVLCDAAVDAPSWQAMFRRAVDATFNRVSVDGDTSTNDTVYGLANGASGVAAQGAGLVLLEEAVTEILAELAYMLVQDGEGATKVMHISVNGAADAADAEKVARTVGHSQLVKTAMYGKDANWGRIVAAIGRSGARFRAEEVRVSLGGVELFMDGCPTSLDFDALLKETLENRDVYIDIVLGRGPGRYAFLASDLTHKYVDINAEYRS